MISPELRLNDNESAERVERLVGVGVFVVTPDHYFLAVKELNTKRASGKIAGMRSLPMETKLDGETDDDALERIFKEEVPVSDLPENNKKCLCHIQLTPGVWLHTYLFEISGILKAEVGTGTDITEPMWIHIQDVSDSPSNKRDFRPGVREVVRAYLKYLEEGDRFVPRVYSKCEDEVPQEIFDQLEKAN